MPLRMGWLSGKAWLGTEILMLFGKGRGRTQNLTELLPFYTKLESLYIYSAISSFSAGIEIMN